MTLILIAIGLFFAGYAVVLFLRALADGKPFWRTLKKLVVDVFDALTGIG